MWGHRLDCHCAICQSVRGLHQTLGFGNCHEDFNDKAAKILRDCEASLREVLRQSELEGRLRPPSEVFAGAPPGWLGSFRGGFGQVLPGPPPKTPPPQQHQGPPPAAPGVPDPKAAQKELPLQLGVKAVPPACPVKVEPEPETLEKKPLAEVEGEPLPRKKKDKSHHKKESRKEPKSEKEAKEPSRTRKRERSPSPCLREAEERSPRGKERKSRRSEEPGAKGGGASSSWQGPRQPSYSPPHRREHRRTGPGWIGEIPRSNHYRWRSSKNKGVVKRAKQERYNQRWK